MGLEHITTKTFQDAGGIFATASGTNTYTATIAPAITAYGATQRFFINFTNANTGASTLNLNGLGAKAIVKNGSTALVSGDISAGQIYAVAYDGVNIQLVGQVGSGGGAPTGPAGGDLSGTYPNPTLNAVLDKLSNVIVPTPSVDDILRFNGVDWVNAAGVTVSGSAGISFFSATPIISAVGAENDNLVGTLAKTPVITAEQTAVKTANSNTVIVSSWLDAAINRTIIDAGTWIFETYAAVDSTTGGRVSTITKQVYKAQTEPGGVTVTMTGAGTTRTVTASGGTPFTLAKIDPSATNTVASYLNTPKGLYRISARTSDTVITIVVPAGYVNEAAITFTSWKKLFGSTTETITAIGTNYALSQHSSAQGTFTTALTDKIAQITFFTSNNTTTVTTTYNGTERNASFNAPLVLRHNEIAGLQGGTADQYYHLTSAEYTALSAWNPPVVTLGDILTSGASFFLSPGSNSAGVYLSMDGGAFDDSFLINIPLQSGVLPYDTSNLRVNLRCAKSAAGTGTVGLIVDYKFLTTTTDISTASTNIAQQDTVVDGWSPNGLQTITLGTMTGVASAQTLQITVTRNSTGPGADSYSGNLRITQIEIEKV